jgi:RNA polymerase sigma-54 factor
VHDYITRARTFLANLRQRETTLQQISEAVVKYQEEFLRHGVRHQAPLTRAEIAADTGLHESTVSRATNDKTVLLPQGTTMPFSDFFVPSLGVQDILRELIENESSPLSDAELARLLAERGHPIARRTVAKYREQMQILPSTLR